MRQEIIDSLPEKLKITGDWETREIMLGDSGLFLTPVFSQRIQNHSPDGFNWGYGGSGPAQLALAILMEFMPVADALDIYQDFKFAVVAAWPQSDFEITLNLKEKIKKLLQVHAG